MSKSRSRKMRRSTVRRPSAPSGWGEMEPWLRAIMAADEAEARGEARDALDVMEAFATGPDGSYFWRPWRADYLTQLALLRPVLPAWASSRWVCHQALQSVSSVDRDAKDQALDLAIELRGGREGLPGRDETDAVARVMDRDWVYRQLFLYEHGGLDRFISKVAAPSLLAASGSVEEWTRVPMGGYRLVGSAPDTTTWADLSTGDEHVIANIGSAVLVTPGECVIGRLVPSPSGELFEMRPMIVSAGMAQGVADDPARWLDVLRAHRRADPDWASCYFPDYDSTLLSDVPTFVWELTLLRVSPSEEVEDSDAWLARAVLDAARRNLEETPQPGRDEADVWPCVGAALLEPRVVRGLAVAAVPEDVPLLDRVSEKLSDPAAVSCRALALELATAA